MPVFHDCYTVARDERPDVGHPKRDRKKINARRRAARRNRRG